MSAYQFIVKAMKRALEAAWRSGAALVVPNDLAARARSMGVDPVRAERHARLSLALELQ